MDKINQRIATELSVGVGQVAAAVELLGEGATVPFIARYRKERTGSLDDTQLRRLKERLEYLRGLEDRRATVLKSIEEQGKLTPDLARAIGDADTKVALEDLYAPYRPKRRTKALATITPSATSRSARTCSGLLMPKPTQIGSSVWSRSQRSWPISCSGSRSRSPVMPTTLT